jgi:hypothetical protein
MYSNGLHVLSKLIPCYFIYYIGLDVHLLQNESSVAKLITLELLHCAVRNYFYSYFINI